MKTLVNLLALLLISASLFAQSPVNKAFQVTVTGKGQPMLFIPGATCSGEEWKETVARYSKNHQCHVFTLAGYAGVAPINSSAYLDTYKTKIIKYINEHKLNKVILVGHSIGGFISLCIAAELKDHLQKVIIVDALPFYAAVFNPNAKAGFDEAKAKSRLANYDKMDETKLKTSQLLITSSLCADSTKWDMIAGWGAKSDHKTMAYTMTEMLGHDMREQISTIKIPVLVMAAFKPKPGYPMFTKEYVFSLYAQQYRLCKSCVVHITPSAKHFIMYDAPEWYYQEIDTFIKAG
ncbi:alpha/beta hydrolase [Pedobacter sp. PAMC26386]|nr:alpha/beta hydrolase [Pedobacter sp. PAMC26386]